MAFTLPAEAQRLASLPDRARRIRSARVGAELSMTVVAAACGFSVSCLSHYESGRHAMSDRQVARVMAAITTLARREPSSSRTTPSQAGPADGLKAVGEVRRRQEGGRE